MSIEGVLDQTVATRGNDRLNALRTQVREEGIGVVSLSRPRPSSVESAFLIESRLPIKLRVGNAKALAIVIELMQVIAAPVEGHLQNVMQMAPRDRFRDHDTAPELRLDPSQLDPQLQQIGNLPGFRFLQGDDMTHLRPLSVGGPPEQDRDSRWRSS